MEARLKSLGILRELPFHGSVARSTVCTSLTMRTMSESGRNHIMIFEIPQGTLLAPHLIWPTFEFVVVRVIALFVPLLFAYLYSLDTYRPKAKTSPIVAHCTTVNIEKCVWGTNPAL